MVLELVRRLVGDADGDRCMLSDRTRGDRPLDCASGDTGDRGDAFAPSISAPNPRDSGAERAGDGVDAALTVNASPIEP